MRKYTVLNPTFKDEIIITETGDPGHADNINSGPKQIFQNTLVNNKEIKEGDSQNRTVTFTSNDSTDAKSWTNVAVMESGENHKSLFEKISTMFKNVRFLYKLLGTTDISAIKDGTVTGILNALDHVAFSGIYSDLHNKPLALPASDVYTWAKQATKPAYTKSEVGLGNVNNTSDQDKPVSTAQQTALDKKVNFTDISRSTAVNIAGKKALDAVEKNPSVEGTMAHDISQIYSNIEKIGTVYTGNPIEITIPGAYRQDPITEEITLPGSGTYIFIVNFRYNIASSRAVAVCLMKGDQNVKVWSFATDAEEKVSAYYGLNEKTFVYIFTSDTIGMYKLAVGINWVGEDENNKALALLQAIRIA